MTAPRDPDRNASERPGDQPAEQDKDAAGAEIGISEGEGSSFEPEEDPEGNA